MGDRLKELRKALDLSQEAFGAKLGVSGAAISKLENEITTLTPQMGLLICQTFNVNRLWLEKGILPMIKAPDTDLVGAFTEIFAKGSDLKKAFSAALVSLSDEQLAVIADVAHRLVDALDSRLQLTRDAQE